MGFHICFGTNTHAFPDLSAPVDVYYDWVDAADEVAKDNADGNLEDVERAAPVSQARPKTGAAQASSGYTEKGRADEFVVDDEEDGEGEFADDDE
jgi:hypothetical protein